MRSFILCSICLLMNTSTEAGDPAAGVLRGHVKILSFKEVELPEKGSPQKSAAHNYADYPLVIRDGERVIAHLTVSEMGDYRAELPVGNYVLDVDKSVAKHARAAPQRFTIGSNQTVQVDLAIDPGVR
jgi:hypothetical protein